MTTNPAKKLLGGVDYRAENSLVSTDVGYQTNY